MISLVPSECKEKEMTSSIVNNNRSMVGLAIQAEQLKSVGILHRNYAIKKLRQRLCSGP